MEISEKIDRAISLINHANNVLVDGDSGSLIRAVEILNEVKEELKDGKNEV